MSRYPTGSLKKQAHMHTLPKEQKTRGKVKEVVMRTRPSSKENYGHKFYFSHASKQAKSVKQEVEIAKRDIVEFTITCQVSGQTCSKFTSFDDDRVGKKMIASK